MAKARAKTVAAYLAGLPSKQRAALEKLRKQILAAAHGAEEYIGYGMPMFRMHGRLCAFSAFTSHLSFFPMTSSLLEKHAGELKGFETSKGTIRFTPEKPIPAALVKKLVKARIVQNLELEGERTRRKTVQKTAKSKARPKAGR